MTFRKKTYSFSLFTIGILSLLISSCGTTYQLKKGFRKNAKEASFFKGFVLYNPKTDTEIINHNGNKYFTPASTTKLYTFYTAYKTLKDSIKSLAYYKTTDSLIIKGTADPSFLYDNESLKTLDFLKNETDRIYLMDENIAESRYGSGWAWDDYAYYYMPEKNLFPIYGNILQFSISGDSLMASPSYLKKRILTLDSTEISRSINSNQFYIAKNRKKAQSSPFITSTLLVANLLSEAIKKR